MLAFVTVVDLIPIQIYAMNLAFLVHPGNDALVAAISFSETRKNQKGATLSPFSSTWPEEGRPEHASSSAEDSPMFQSRNLLSVSSQWHCLLSNSFTSDAVLHKPQAKLNANVLFLQISH